MKQREKLNSVVNHLASPCKSAENCETFCTKDLTTFLDNKNKIKATNMQIDLLKDLDEDELKINIADQGSGEVDLAYFYSSPLVQMTTDPQDPGKQNLTPLYNLLDYEMEYTQLVKILQQLKKETKINKMPLNFESFKQVLAQNPKMIHITCHGDYDFATREFYLAFEDNGSGLLEKFTQSRLKELLGSDGNNVKIAFISSCHSEKVGEIFYQAGIPVVICVNQDTAVLDKVCILFMRHFYMQLMAGRTVQKAFEEA